MKCNRRSRPSRQHIAAFVLVGAIAPNRRRPSGTTTLGEINVIVSNCLSIPTISPHITPLQSFTPRGSSFDLNGLKKFTGWVYLFLPLWILLENVAQDKNPCESSSYIFWPWIFGVILSFSLFILKILFLKCIWFYVKGSGLL